MPFPDTIGFYEKFGNDHLLEHLHIYGITPTAAVVLAERLDARTAPSNHRYHFNFKHEETVTS